MISIAAQLVRTKPGGKVLVVDDEKMNRILMNDLLTACGFIVLEEARDNLTKMIVHDMRSPLMGISGMLELIKMTTEDVIGETASMFVDNASAATQKLVEMVNSMLDISRMENRQMPLNLKENDLAKSES
jgi:signal transduction histidine kinase